MSEVGTETQNGSELCYAVEARYSSLVVEPLVTALADEVGRPFILGSQWRRVPIGQAPGGVPNRLYESHPTTSGYLTYEAAMAIAHWFLALCDRSSIEVRLVRYQHTYTHAITRVGEGPLILHGFAADRDEWPCVSVEEAAKRQ